MKVLVTGGTGVLGAAVVRALLEAQDQVIVLSSSGNLNRLGSDAREITSSVCDLRSAVAIKQALNRHRPYCIIHLAALLPAAAERDVLAAIDLNVRSTATLWSEARKVETSRFVYASTKSVYGPLSAGFAANGERFIEEDEPTTPTTIYGATKLAGEAVLHAQSRSGGPEVVTLRFATIFAPAKGRQHQASVRAKTAVLSDMLDALLLQRGFSIEFGGEQVDDMIYVEDAAQGVVAAAHARQLRARVYHIATGVPRTLHDFAAVAGAVFGSQASVTIGPGNGYMGQDAIYGVMSTDLAKRDLGFSAEGDLSSTLRRYGALAERMGLTSDSGLNE